MSALRSRLTQRRLFEQGAPFTDSLFEHKKMLYTVAAIAGVVVLCSLEWAPWFNEMMELVPFPTWEFKSRVLTIMAADFVAVYACEKVLHFLFYNRACRTSGALPSLPARPLSCHGVPSLCTVPAPLPARASLRPPLQPPLDAVHVVGGCSKGSKAASLPP